jgi:hypothetical protein
VTPFEVVALCALAVIVGAWIERRRWKAREAAQAPARAAIDASIDQLRVQLAGCGVAARGGLRAEQVLSRGAWGWSPSYQDVLEMRTEVEALRQAREQAIDAIDDSPSPFVSPVTKDVRTILVASREAMAFGPLATAKRFKTVQDVIEHLKREE